MLEKDFIELCNTYEQIIIYGAGMVGKLVYKQLCTQRLGDKVIAFAVSDTRQNKEQVLGKQVCSIELLQEKKSVALVVIATMPQIHSDIEATLKGYDFKHIVKVDEELFRSLSESYIYSFKSNNRINATNIDVLLMASDNNASSGAFLCMADLCEELNKNGLKTLIVLPVYGDGEEILVEKDICYTYIPSLNWVYPIESLKQKDYSRIHQENQAAIAELAELCKDYHVRLIHNNTTYTYIGAVVAKMLGIPIVWHLREDISVQGCDFINRKKSIEFINQSDKVLVVSQFIRDCIEGLQNENIQVVYDGVDISKYYVERNIFESRDVVTLIMVGAITPIKGQEQLIEAIHLLNPQHQSQLKVLFLGKGDREYLNVLHQKIEQYDLQEKIQFMGMQSDTTQFYKKADIAVVCSQADSFGRVTVEAQLAGCAVIGANTGATPELIKDMQTGLLYEYGNSKDLSEKIMHCITHKKTMRDIARRGQTQAVTKYTKERNAEKIIEAYIMHMN